MAIDPWNSLINFSDFHFLKRTFGHFSYFKKYRGVVLITVSSSFDPPKKMSDDADIELKRITIPLYNDVEISSLVEYKRMLQLLPPFQQLSNSTMLKITGRLPRMVYFMEQTYRKYYPEPWSEMHFLIYRILRVVILAKEFNRFGKITTTR